MSEYFLPPEEFLSPQKKYALVGGSDNWSDYGYELFLELEKNNIFFYPLSPEHTQINGVAAFPSLVSFEEVDGVIFATEDEDLAIKYLHQMQDVQMYKAWFEDGLTTAGMMRVARENSFQVVKDYNLKKMLINGEFSFSSVTNPLQE